MGWLQSSGSTSANVATVVSWALTTRILSLQTISKRRREQQTVFPVRNRVMGTIVRNMEKTSRDDARPLDEPMYRVLRE